MSASSPILLAFDDNTELYNIVVSNGCGVYSPPGDGKALAAKIEEISKMDPEKVRMLGTNGRKFVVENMSYEYCTKRLIDETEAIRL